MDLVRNVSAFEIYGKKKKLVNLSEKVQKSRSKIKLLHNSKINSNTKLHFFNNLKAKENIKNIKAQNKDLKKIKILVPKINSYKIKNKNFYKISNMLPQSTQSLTVVSSNKDTKVTKVYSETSNSVSEMFNNSMEESVKLFEWLLYPFNKDEFFRKNWEKAPLYIKRNKSKYYRSLLSTPMLDNILRYNNILYGKHLDITSFTNDIKENHNPPGRALPSVVWDYFANGCSIRLLNPQMFIPKLHTLNATLQEFFGCLVGVNSYLTPPNSQGFAPHYDDIEAFILQIEGKKRWRLYKSSNYNEHLPRYSSRNYSEKEIGKPFFETVIKAGDLLYFPRGIIHQADTVGFDEHSLHITLSVYQNNSWGDFLEKLLPSALSYAIENDIRFRKGLPLNFWKHLGFVYSDNNNTSIRKKFLKQVKFLLNVLITKYIYVDRAVDKLAKNHIHDFLPPVLNEFERLCSVYEGGERMIKNGLIINRVEIEPDTLIRLTRAHCARLVEENGSYRLYYSCDNSKEYHEYELQFLEIDLEFLPAIREIVVKFPQYIKVENLPIDKLDKKIQIVADLWEKAIIVSKHPLTIIDD